MDIEHKFKLGQKVWSASWKLATEKHPCPDCNDTRVWHVKTGSGTEFEVECARCKWMEAGQYKISRRDPHVYERTITSIGFQLQGGEKVPTYGLDGHSCQNNIYFHETEDEAFAAANELVKCKNEAHEQKEPERRAIERRFAVSNIIDALKLHETELRKKATEKLANLIDAIEDLPRNYSCSIENETLKIARDLLDSIEADYPDWWKEEYGE